MSGVKKGRDGGDGDRFGGSRGRIRRWDGTGGDSSVPVEEFHN